MQWFRTIRPFVRLMVLLFVAAQFAGVVSSPLDSARAFTGAADFHMHHHHADGQKGLGSTEHSTDQSSGHFDRCCALHAFFAGIMPPVIEIGIADRLDQRLFADLNDIAHGMTVGRLDRPPRPLV